MNLWLKEDSELFDYSGREALEEMTKSLVELGYADAAKETYELLLIIKQAIVRADVIKDRLGPVWKAVEKTESLDWGKDSIEEAIMKYRGEGGR